MHAFARRSVPRAVLLETMAAGLATAYFAANFAFVGFAIRAYMQVRRELDVQDQTLQRLKDLEHRFIVDAAPRASDRRKRGG